MNLRDLHWTFPWLSGFLGALGGWSWKWTRRYLLPATGAAMALAYGVAWWRCALYAVASAAAFSLPYSPERMSLGQIFLVGTAYGATPWLLQFRVRRAWWPALTGLLLAGGIAAGAEANWWTHKWTEGLVFAVHGFMVSWTIDRRAA